MELKILVDYEDFIILHNIKTGKYYCIDFDNEHTIFEVALVYAEEDLDKSIEQLMCVNFDYDYCGEMVSGANYLYFTKI